MNKLQQKIEEFKDTWKNVGYHDGSAYEHPIMFQVRLAGEIVKDTCNVAMKKGISEAVNYLKLACDIAYGPMQ